MTCKYYKIKKKNNKKEKRIYYYCSYLKIEIPFCRCRQCEYKEFKVAKKQQKTSKKVAMKKRTYKLAKAEKNRFSILYPDLNKCCICGSSKSVEINEIFEGSYRSLSIKYGMITPFCQLHHNAFHNDRLMNLYYKAMFQKEFEKTHSQEEFIKIFKKNYVYLYERMRGG